MGWRRIRANYSPLPSSALFCPYWAGPARSGAFPVLCGDFHWKQQRQSIQVVVALSPTQTAIWGSAGAIPSPSQSQTIAQGRPRPSFWRTHNWHSNGKQLGNLRRMGEGWILRWHDDEKGGGIRWTWKGGLGAVPLGRRPPTRSVWVCGESRCCCCNEEAAVKSVKV